LLEQGVEAGEFTMTDTDQTSRFMQAVAMEAVRQIHDDPSSRPEEATVEAIRRLIVGGSGAEIATSHPGAAARVGKKPKKRAKKK
jgi:hypothetical protein